MATEPATARTVEPEFRDKLVSRWEELMIDTGAPDYETAISRAVQVFQFFLDNLSLIRTKEDLRNVLGRLPDPSALEKKLIWGVFQFLPQIFRYGAKQLAAKAERDLPPLPRGRPNIDLERKADIVAYVGKLHMQGCSLEISKKRTAARFTISESTVQRIWDDRGSIDPADFRSALNYLMKPIGADQV